ncbi:MAG: ABC transporter substrate-binding protein [Acidimicrobiales bacterium]
MRPARSVRMFAVATLSVGLVATACSSSKSSSSGGSAGSSSSTSPTAGGNLKQGGVFKLGIVEPTAIDPYNSQETEGQKVTKVIFDGLVDVDAATGQLKPAVAKTWDKNADCTQWTFHLGESKFSSGEAVTAQSFIDGMNRAARLKAASDTATFMEDIKGFEDVHGTGAKDAPAPTAQNMSGLSTPDPKTLVIALGKPNCEFDKVTVQPVYLPVPKGTPDPDATNNTPYQDTPIGNGPFMMKGAWQHKSAITLVRNPGYVGYRPAHLDEVDFTILPDSSALADEYKGYQAGTFDYARIPTELLGQAKSTYDPQQQFQHYLTYGINYVGVQIKGAPFGPNGDEKALHARRAVSFAIDRKAIASGVFNGFETPATAIVPPPFKAYYQADACETCVLDPAKAKAEAQMAGLDANSKITLAFNTGGGHEAWTSAVCDQVQKNAGIGCTTQGTSFKELLKSEKDPNGKGLFRAGWSADYPSPLDFLYPLLGTGSGDNRGKYSNKEFDALLDKAKATPSDADRVKLVQQAEKLAIGKEVGLIPMFYRDIYRLGNSKKFKGIKTDFFENPTLAEISLV